MKLRNMLLAATVLALPVAAKAQPVTGLYVGGGFGYNYLQDTKVHGSAVGIGTATGKLTGSGGPIALGSVGYGFGNGLRVELEGNWRYNHMRLTSNPLGSGGANVQNAGVMANVLYDFNLGWPVQPYVGVGAGYEWTNLQDAHGFTFSGVTPPAKATFSGTHGGFAAQGILGAAFPIPAVPGLAITAEYRFMAVFDDQSYSGTAFVGNGFTPASVKLNDQFHHAALIGVRYNFGVAPAPAPAPAPVAAPAPAPARTYLVFFDWDKADLTARARQIVAEAAQASTRVAVTRIEVSGHTDLSGGAAYNQRLSQRRADNVAAELVRDGVPRQSISVFAYGKTRPLVPTADGVREPQNRRVEIVLK